MMRLVHNQQVPTGVNRLPGAHRVFGKERHVTNHELAVEKRICFSVVLYDRFATVFVEDAEEQIKPPQKLYEPLVHERLRQQDQYPRRSSREVQTMKDQTGLDGLAEADFIRE